MGDMAAFNSMASDADIVVRDGLAAVRANTAVKVSGAMNTFMADAIRFTPRIFARKIAGSLQRRRG